MRISSATRFPWVRLSLLAAALAGAAPAAVGQESARRDYHQRRERLENMTAAEKEQLLRQKERFDQLPSQERQRLRDTCKALAQAPDGERLFGVLRRYCEWLKTLTPVERAEVLALPPETRIARIQELVKKQEEHRLRRLANLSHDEGEAVREWFLDLVKPHEDELWALLPADHRRYIESRADDAEERRRRIVSGLLYRFNQGDKLRALLPEDPQRVEQLLERLSQQQRDEFSRLSEADQRQLLVRWVYGAFSWRGFSRVSEEELQEFFVERLPREEQIRLEMMPRDAMQQELRHLYLRHRYFRPGGGREGGPTRGSFPEGFPRGKRKDDGNRREERGPQDGAPSRREPPR